MLRFFIIATFFATFGVLRTPPVALQVAPGSAAATAGVQPGDRIRAIAGNRMTTFEDLQQYVALRPGREVAVDLIRNDRPLRLQVKLGDQTKRDEFGQRF